jgi:hypothetical protein
MFYFEEALLIKWTPSNFKCASRYMQHAVHHCHYVMSGVRNAARHAQYAAVFMFYLLQNLSNSPPVVL